MQELVTRIINRIRRLLNHLLRQLPVLLLNRISRERENGGIQPGAIRIRRIDVMLVLFAPRELCRTSVYIREKE